jgi:DNA-binding transcriptional ArsR family regulator
MEPLAALSVPARRQIVEILASEGQMPARAIARRFTLSAPAISQHLKALRDAGLVTVERRGTQRLYTLRPEALAQIAAWLGGLHARLDALARQVDKDE